MRMSDANIWTSFSKIFSTQKQVYSDIYGSFEHEAQLERNPLITKWEQSGPTNSWRISNVCVLCLSINSRLSKLASEYWLQQTLGSVSIPMRWTWSKFPPFAAVSLKGKSTEKEVPANKSLGQKTTMASFQNFTFRHRQETSIALFK